MPDEQSVEGLVGDDDDAREPRVEWEVPEVAAVVILVAVGLLVLGGLVTGIAAATGAPEAIGPGAGTVTAGSSMQLGAVWADPVLAIVLLGVCWWQVGAWSGGVSDTDPAEVTCRIRRGRRIALWANAALVLTLAGSVALLAGVLLSTSHRGNLTSLIWSRDMYEAASVLAVAAIVSGGIWAGTRLRPRSDGTDTSDGRLTARRGGRRVPILLSTPVQGNDVRHAVRRASTSARS